MYKLFSFVVWTFLLSACNENNASDASGPAASDTAFDLNAARTEITNSYDAFEQAIMKGDSATLYGFYHSEAVAYPANGNVINKREQIASMFASFPKMGITRIETNTTDVFGGPEYVIESGTFELSNDAQTIDKGKYMVVWRQENGRWKNYRDIWNSDLPLPANAQK